MDLSKASVIKREVDVVIGKLNDIFNGSNSMNEHSRSIFLASVQDRIQELENFFLVNSEDERSVLFEKERLRLRKAIQPLHTSRDAKSVVTSDRSFSAGAMSQRLERVQSSQSIRDNRSLSQAPGASLTASQLQTGNTTIASGQIQPSRKSPNQERTTIYSWEGGRERNAREAISIEDFHYEPTPIPGFYSRRITEIDNDEMDKFVDFQIILTQEEMTALAARKKAQKVDAKLHKNQAASSSVHTATPYVDPKRIAAEMLRPGHPDRWLHP